MKIIYRMDEHANPKLAFIKRGYSLKRKYKLTASIDIGSLLLDGLAMEFF